MSMGIRPTWNLKFSSIISIWLTGNCCVWFFFFYLTWLNFNLFMFKVVIKNYFLVLLWEIDNIYIYKYAILYLKDNRYFVKILFHLFSSFFSSFYFSQVNINKLLTGFIITGMALSEILKQFFLNPRYLQFCCTMSIYVSLTWENSYFLKIVA